MAARRICAPGGRLQKANVSSQYFLVPNAQHGPGLYIDKYFKMMTDFFLKESGITGVGTGNRNNPIKFSVSQNYPNPFNPNTKIEYYLPQKSNITFEIYNILGQRVYFLDKKISDSGNHSIIWNGRDSSGRTLSSGIYTYSIRASKSQFVKKMILIR